ncbi:hypothetical protein A2Y99_03760 [Candidatus Gottesmanbacteria bacterium RBG_13_37_7]|uniref:Membrane protein 6-pyruvoyl-tetrahydropterin synthase-related domain-containing protein n=1 Tax=Candidatus Gottesmanbacteria bacterium RBG_13_37_7 TaxID=1798369 RepID=A0A1F5YK63_9BACT|nr:MAG: hypothetical protein A2Y99_03760 [Candidatus Gottesmanbacteria bacterium RBG_13_37_7]
MFREIKDGQIPPRWSDFLNHGYGYPLFSFAYPLPYYAGLLIKSIGTDFVSAIKILFVLSVIMSSFFMFLLGRELAGSFAGFISAIFYTVAPFRLVDLYVRGSIGESLSLAIFPLLFFLTIKYIQRPNIFRMSFCSLALSGLILTHNIMAVVFFPIFVIFYWTIVFTYYQDAKIYTFKYFLPVILLGLGLASYFFVPAILEKKYIVLSNIKLADVRENFVGLKEYFLSPWSYDKPSFQLGWAHILGAVIGLFSVIFSNAVYKKKYISLVIMLTTAIFTIIFFAHSASLPFWNIPPLSWIDFPWRLLTPLAFLMALMTVFLSIHKLTRFIGIILVLLTVILSYRFATPRTYIQKPESFYYTNDGTTTSKNEFMPLWVKQEPTARWVQKAEIEQGSAVITDLTNNSKSIRFRIVTEGESIVKLNSIYFPGWEYSVDKTKLEPLISSDGLVRLRINTGDYIFEGNFKETPVRLWSDIVSVVSMGILISACVYYLMVIYPKNKVL